MRAAYLICALLLSMNVHCEALFTDKGFHWYGIEEEESEEQVLSPQQEAGDKSTSMYERLMEMRAAAKESMAKALLEPSVENTADYMRKQQEFMKANQAFVRNWEIALLLHPELDAKLDHPTDNNAIALRNDKQALLKDKIIRSAATQYGFLLFYKGNSEVSEKFITMLNGFVQENHVQMISVSTDNKASKSLPQTRFISPEEVESRLGLKPNYEPAVFLVHFKSGSIQPLSYGFMAQVDFKNRFFDVITNFKRLSYQGIQL